MWRKLRYLLEAAAVYALFALFRLLPLDAASWLGGWVGRTFGVWSAPHRTASRNLALALPELSEDARRRILRAMWDNLGRSIGEYPHLARPLMASRIAIGGAEHLEQVKRSGKSALFISGHFANAEIAPKIAAVLGMPLMLLYRPANNAYVDWLLRRVRADFSVAMHAKGVRAARHIVQAVGAGQAIGMLVDQKTNEGIAAPFFGRDAMTSPATAELALKYGLPVLPAQVVRTRGARFQATIFPPLSFTKTGDHALDVARATAEINTLMERWIRTHPEQWFWVHHRWPKA